VRSRHKGELGAMPFDPFVALLEGESQSPRCPFAQVTASRSRHSRL
jgi:hypothetical protein